MSDTIDLIKRDRENYAKSLVKQKRKPRPKIIRHITIARPSELTIAEIPEEQVVKIEKGYVYFIWIPEIENNIFGKVRIKIGSTKDFKRRIMGLQTGNPFRLEFYKILHIERYKEIEKQFHAQFHQGNIRLEWFHLLLDDIEKYTEKIGLSNQAVSPTEYRDEKIKIIPVENSNSLRDDMPAIIDEVANELNKLGLRQED